MKLVTLAIVLTSFTFSISAQNQEARIVYDIKMESQDPEIQAQLAMVGGSTMVTAFKGDKTYQSTSMGSIMETITITDQSSKKGVMLVNGMMGKFGAMMDLEEVEENKKDTDIDIELVDETKEIKGYNCKKALIVDEDGNETVFWYTDEIVAPKMQSEYFKEQVPGFPLEIYFVTPQMTMSFIATEVEEKVKKAKSLFKIEIPEGYTEHSFQELQSMVGGV